ncbi:2577d48c-f79d-462c-bb09-39e862aa7450 [Thermothielavioides terrestris]|uniref:2577d48c-f79d-462c-bb09-39e862aa7450 n=1 Tax=Thermothielavioides terrestris TaxID=2587410 RepID=A0A446BV65_9PEZI|nr:2577d48c-f79d-462c-bb09-39e862aa7450 [Thermothielavioides terrestris]
MAPGAAATSSGANAFVVSRTPKKLASNTSRATRTSASSAGTTYGTPALLTRMSSVPPVALRTAATAASMLAREVTSSGSRVTSGRCANSGGILAGSRAVAKTWKPRFWKATARAAPMPPALQPVMRTVFFGGMPHGPAGFDPDELEFCDDEITVLARSGTPPGFCPNLWPFKPTAFGSLQNDGPRKQSLMQPREQEA